MANVDQVTKMVDPALKSVDSAVTSVLTNPSPVAELGFAVAVLVLIIAVHGWCMGSITGLFGARFARFTPQTRQWRVSLLMGFTITLLALTHLFETLIWAAPIWWFGMIPNQRDAYFFVLEAYTTLGETTVSLPESWRLAGPMIAITGLFTFSWTGSVMVYVMTETGRRRRAATEAAAKPGLSADAAEPT